MKLSSGENKNSVSINKISFKGTEEVINFDGLKLLSTRVEGKTRTDKLKKGYLDKIPTTDGGSIHLIYDTLTYIDNKGNAKEIFNAYYNRVEDKLNLQINEFRVLIDTSKLITK